MKHSFVKCEAVKTAYRQSKDGMVVSFAIHPNEMPKELALAPVGTRVLLAVAEIADYETTPAPAAGGLSDEEKAARVRALSDARSVAAKQAYAESDDGTQAVTRAALLCRDTMFQQWASVRSRRPATEEAATVWLRWCAGVKSRSEIATNPRALAAFLTLEREYRDFVQFGEMPR